MIIRRLASIFPSENDNGERVVAVLWSLNRQDEVYRGSNVLPPEWLSLREFLNIPAAFEGYARKLLAHTKQMVAYQEAKGLILDLVCQLDAKGANIQGEDQRENTRNEDQREKTRQSWLKYLLAALGIGIPAIAIVLEDLPWGRSIFSSFDDFFRIASGIKLVTILGAIYIFCEVVYNLFRLCRSEITGEECAKNIIGASVSFGGGVAGAATGATAGTLVFGPIGTIIGGIVGGLVGSLIGNYTARRLFDYLASLFATTPREEALKNAYVFLGVQENVSEKELKAAYNRARLRYYPDKGGSHEDFLQLELHWQVIQAAREANQPRANDQVEPEPIALPYY